MATIVKRGARSDPKFYVQFDRGRTADGERVRSTRLLKGVVNIVEARQELARVERELVAGRDPFPTVVVVPGASGSVRPLLRHWSETLTNRNAADDRYEATRHSFVSRNLKAGVQLDEVSAAVGHASPATTRRHCAHFIRKTFNPALRQGLAPASRK